MGLRFDIGTTNWIAYLLEPGAPLPETYIGFEMEVLRELPHKIAEGFYSSKSTESRFREIASRATILANQVEFTATSVRRALEEMQQFFHTSAGLD